MNQESANRHPDENIVLCEHQWVELGADAVYCWRRQCRLCGAIEGQEHTLVEAAYTVVGCCAHPYVCEGCGYIPQ
ncbi:MAG: hypothetical protein WHX52_18340 [Anaerolineae bacterium]